MKLVFDSEYERKNYMDTHCPNDVGLDEFIGGNCHACDEVCSKCWAEAGCELVVENKDASIMHQLERIADALEKIASSKGE